MSGFEAFRDFGLAWRTLVRAPAFFAGAVAMMAGALGVSAAAFGMLSAVVPASPVFPGGERVVNISPVEEGRVATDRGLALDVAESLRTTEFSSLEAAVAINRVRAVVSSDSMSRPVFIEAVRGDYFGLFNARMMHGRALTVVETTGSVDNGASFGILVSVALVGLARHYLVGFGTAGWGLVLVVPIVLSAVILIAALVPAWRATRQQPMGLLRQT